MTDMIVQLVEAALSSPWGLLALAAVAAIDGFFPVVPSESLVVTAGVFAAAGNQTLALIIAAERLARSPATTSPISSDVEPATGSPVG